MTNNILTRIILVTFLSLFTAFAQDEQDVDAIEKARQAKEAAEKAAAEASAATEAAIEAAAQKAAKEAREEAKRKKEEEEARKIAEAKAAEEAELDAAATAAAEEAKRKMAEELGLEYESPTDEVAVDSDTTVSDTTEEFVAKEPLGINVGFTGSVGFINGEYIVNTPVGGSVVINTPYSFTIGGENGLNLTASIALGVYNGKAGDDEALSALLFGAGANATLFKILFSESHLSYIGSGLGVRNFSGVSLERIMKKGLNLPVNVLIGGEGFLALKADDYTDNSTYWGGLGVRLDYDF
tara:strand:+ start:435 stop:1325 length:891 start_codon:yes stop_codon:yes gene_type:complete